MVWDDTKDSTSELTSTEWNNHVSDQKSRITTPASFPGSFTVTSTETISVTAPPFKPSSIKFEIHANGGQNVSTSGSGGNSVDNSSSQMTGFARDDGTRQATGNAASGNSINNIRRFSTNSNAILLEYSSQNGDNLGTLKGDVTSFDSSGFTVDFMSHAQNEVIIYTAFK
jgi:hypothetical protein